MRFTLLLLALTLTACGGATDTAATRYNFAVVAGMNQTSAAGDVQLAQKITAQLTRDPQGKFATRVFDFFAPKLAYAQGINLSGEPVANAIVCGREALVGEPQVQPLCAFTLADGKAANTVVPGTKAGTYNVVFTAQVPSTEPVKDSTTVIVAAGPASPTFHTSGPLGVSPYVLPASTVQDQYGNSVAAFEVVGDDIISVAADGVTLSWSTTTDPYRFLEIRNPATKAIIGHLRYRIGSGNPRLEWVAYGINGSP
jgi:hypothetical protein